MFETIPLLKSGAGIPVILIVAMVFYFLNKIANNTKPPPTIPKKQLPQKKEFHWWD